MLERLELWYEKIGRKLLYIAGCILFGYIFLKYLLTMVAPFIIAWGLATLLNPFVTYLKKKLKMPRALGTILSMIIIVGSLFILINQLLKQLWYQIVSFAASIPFYKEQVTEIIPIIQARIDDIQDILPIPNALPTLSSLVDGLLNSIAKFFQAIIPWTYDIVSKVPQVIIFIVVMLIATFFMTKDYHTIKAFVKAQIPSKFNGNIRTLQHGLWHALGGYIRTQLIMMTITFTICMSGLFILKAPYVLLISVCIAIFDALPIFGSGAILIPWAIYNMIMGHYGIGIGLFIIYATIFLSRQLIEPRILSGQIGVYALVTVMSMYIGYKAMGVLGLIIGPVTVVIITTLQKAGVLPAFKKISEEQQ